MADVDGLEAMYRCPAAVTDPELIALHATLWLRLSMELANVPVTTVQLMRASEVLASFVVTKQMESKGYTEEGGFTSRDHEKAWRTFTHMVMKDWDATVIAARPAGMEAIRDYASRAQKVIAEALSATAQLSPDVRNEILSRMAQGMAHAGLEVS